MRARVDGWRGWIGCGECRRHRHVGPPLRCVPQALSRALSDVSAVSRVLPRLRRINNASSDLVDRFPKLLPQYKDDDPPKEIAKWGLALFLSKARNPLSALS